MFHIRHALEIEFNPGLTEYGQCGVFIAACEVVLGAVTK
jgi:hypothetical protein